MIPEHAGDPAGAAPAAVEAASRAAEEVMAFNAMIFSDFIKNTLLITILLQFIILILHSF